MAAKAIEDFVLLIQQRSRDNQRAVHALDREGLHGHVIGVLRQELDSLIRVIFLLTLPASQRAPLASQTLSGSPWRIGTKKVTDRAMVNVANNFEGWTESVYRFGCAFIHLSQFHDHLTRDPFQALAPAETAAIVGHLAYYHGWNLAHAPTLARVAPYLPRVFDKIASNLNSYLGLLLAGQSL